MYFQVEYIEDKLQEYIQEDDDILPLENAEGTVGCDTRFMLGTDKRATITMNWSWFHHHANIREGDICAFHFKRKDRRHLSLTVHRLWTQCCQRLLLPMNIIHRPYLAYL